MKPLYLPSRKIFILLFFSILVKFNPVHGQNIYDKEAVKPAIQFKVEPFGLKDVRLLDGPFKKALELNHKYLLECDVDRLLHNFRINAGLPSSAKALAGWEAPEIELRGHFTGHFLSACALMFSSTSDNRLILKADSVVKGLAKCQDVLGKSGYLSAYPESFIDRVETGKPVWAPWYTLHKIFAGLIDVYIHMDNKQALEIAEKMAAWVKVRTDKLSEEQMQKMLKVEFGGMSETLYNLYVLTGKNEYLNVGKRFEQKSFFEPLSLHQDKLKGLHVNTQIPKIIGAARAFEFTGDEYYNTIASFFWNQVVNTRSYSTGGTSHYEYWRSEPYNLSDQLSSNDHENCCTHNMLKLTSDMFKWEPNPVLADYYERALLNGIMGTQHPEEGGAFMYYVPMKPGLFRYFCEPETSFVCCSGTGIESYAKFGDNIYFHNKNELYVNQFIASELDWKENNVKLIQSTEFPEEEGTTLVFKMKKPAGFALKIRIPYWTYNGCKININGKSLETTSSSGSYFVIKRQWKDNDKVEVSMPMSLHVHKMPDNPKRVSFMYGPLVLAGTLGTKNMSKDMAYGMRGDAYIMNTEGAARVVPKFVVNNDRLDEWIKPVKGKPLTFITQGIGKPDDVMLIPFNKIYGVWYSVYWDIFARDEYSNRLKKYELPAGIIDKFTIGDKIDEDEHDFQAYYLERGDTLGRKWVKSKSWFRFDINITPDKQNILKTTFFGNENDAIFGLYIDGTEIKTFPVQVKSGEFYSVEYMLPMENTRGKERIAISFKVPEKKKVVSVGETTLKKDLSRYETPRFFGCEIMSNNQ